jgi:hypothetical protein
MKQGSRSAAVVVGLFATGAIGASGFGVGAAAASHPAQAKPKPLATFQMFANVDAEGDLGSNYDAVSAGTLPGSSQYRVKFTKPIGHCAAVVQDGKAGGPDDLSLASSDIVPLGKKGYDITFGVPDQTGQDQLKHEPFMVTVTCKS